MIKIIWDSLSVTNNVITLIRIKYLNFLGIHKWAEELPVQTPHASGEREYTSHLW